MTKCPSDANWYDSSKFMKSCQSGLGIFGCTREKGHKGLHHRHDPISRECEGGWSDEEAKFSKYKMELREKIRYRVDEIYALLDGTAEEDKNEKQSR